METLIQARAGWFARCRAKEIWEVVVSGCPDVVLHVLVQGLTLAKRAAWSFGTLQMWRPSPFCTTGRCQALMPLVMLTSVALTYTRSRRWTVRD